MNDVEVFAQITALMRSNMAALARLVPLWHDALSKLEGMAPGAMRHHGIEGSSGQFWDRVAADLHLDELEATREQLLAALAAPLDRPAAPPGPDRLTVQHRACLVSLGGSRS